MMPSAALFALRPDLRPKLKRPLRVLAIDPGCTHSAYVIYDAEEEEVLEKAKLPNAELREVVRVASFNRKITDCAIEMIGCYGFTVGSEVFLTCVWIGRFVEQWKRETEPTLILRRKISAHVCGAGQGDKSVLKALTERFGPIKMFGVTGDMASALAVAVTFADSKVREMGPNAASYENTGNAHGGVE